MRSLKYRCQQSASDLLQGARYRLIDNGAKVLGVAHCDCVTAGAPKRYRQRGTIVENTCLDDRLGVHILLDLLPGLGLACDVLLTDDEEIGQSTAELFKAERQYNWAFSFDRRGTDAVCYEYRNMAEPIARHFELGQGSFSDICYLDIGCAGLNIGTGYYNGHTRRSYANLDETAQQVRRFRAFYHEMSAIHLPDERHANVLADDGWLDWREYERACDLLDAYDVRREYRDLDEFIEDYLLESEREALEFLQQECAWLAACEARERHAFDDRPSFAYDDYDLR